MIALLLPHVLLTTAGYVGLIAANLHLLLVARNRDPHIIRAGLTVWRKSSQVFGPMLAIGMLLGFWLASVVQAPLGSLWLVITYALIAAAIVVQVSVMAPWQLRCNRMLEAGVVPPITPVVLVLAVLSIFYSAIVWLMLSRPG